MVMEAWTETKARSLFASGRAPGPVQPWKRPQTGSTLGPPVVSTGHSNPHHPATSVDDAFLKKPFSHPRTIELLIRRYLPEWADRVDFATLEALPTELIEDRLGRRYTDMAWRVRSLDGDTACEGWSRRAGTKTSTGSWPARYG